jgi:predicted dehydrogenase
MVARIGVIGTGWWATRAHLPAIVANPDADLIAIADPIGERRNRAESVFHPKRSYADHREMLEREELDGVVIAVPHTAHFEVAMAGIRSGSHLMLEKPMVVESRHATELLAESAKRGLEIVVGYPYHYNQQVLAVRESIANGEIGELLYVHSLFASIVWDLFRGDVDLVADAVGFTITPTGKDTYGDPALSGGGQAIVQITHSAALLLFMTGLEPVDVFAFMENRDLRVDLVDALAVRFAGGCIGTIGSTGSTVRSQEELLEYRLYGTEGHILFDLGTSAVRLFRADGSVDQDLLLRETPALRTYSSGYPEDAPVNNLVDVILGRGESQTPPQLAATVVDLLEAAYKSASSGQRESLPNRTQFGKEESYG